MSEVFREKAGSIACPGCGGRPVWHPQTKGLKCPFCDATQSVAMEKGSPMEYPLEAAPTAESEDWGETKKVIRCQGCGAETILGENDSATFCAFCGNPHVLENQEKAGVKPETVIPFAVSQETAVASFRKWLKGKLFAPGKAKKMASLGQLAGVYLPHIAGTGLVIIGPVG